MFCYLFFKLYPSFHYVLQSSRTWCYLQCISTFSKRCQTKVFLAVAKCVKLQEGQPFKIANSLLIVTGHNLCVFLSILVLNWQHFASKLCLTLLHG